MDREKLQVFARSADADLSSVRRGLLIIGQTGDDSGIAVVRAGLARLKAAARNAASYGVATLVCDCEATLGEFSEDGPSRAAYRALDVLSRIEAALLDTSLSSDEFLGDVSRLVDASFANLLPDVDTDADTETPVEDQAFEIDDETLEIFRAEADELIANIKRALERLARAPGDQNNLWEIRRNAHTLKGSAGIVGLTEACRIAHRMEDLLDSLVETRGDAGEQVLEFLNSSARALDEILSATETPDLPLIESRYEAAIASLTASPEIVSDTPAVEGSDPPADPPAVPKAPTPPIVRVSLDRLDELIRVSRNIAVNRAALTTKLTELGRVPGVDGSQLADLAALFEIGRRLTLEMHERLTRIRMVRFGMLETRLARAVHVTCLDENKKAKLEIENPDVEIDTQIIDALIEPLLHLLKNAVVHGIESPETRRLIGKPELGEIRIRLEADDGALVMSVADDGGGIPVSRLRDKAVAAKLLDETTLASMKDREVMKLIFDRGLTTAKKLDLNAGRGVGMSIVKESIESRGGSVIVESQPQRGTTFTILMPLPVSGDGPVEEPDTAREETPKTSVQRPPLVLIVDDSAVIRRQMQRLVEKAGLTSITANNGADALELLLNGDYEPNIILSDVEMPQIDGWSFLEYVKTDENLGHIPVVIMTSLDGEEHRTRAFDLGAADYIVKPFKAQDLERVFETIGSVAVAQR